MNEEKGITDSFRDHVLQWTIITIVDLILGTLVGGIVSIATGIPFLLAVGVAAGVLPCIAMWLWTI